VNSQTVSAFGNEDNLSSPSPPQNRIWQFVAWWRSTVMATDRAAIDKRQSNDVSTKQSLFFHTPLSHKNIVQIRSPYTGWPEACLNL